MMELNPPTYELIGSAVEDETGTTWQQFKIVLKPNEGLAIRQRPERMMVKVVSGSFAFKLGSPTSTSEAVVVSSPEHHVSILDSNLNPTDQVIPLLEGSGGDVALLGESGGGDRIGFVPWDTTIKIEAKTVLHIPQRPACETCNLTEDSGQATNAELIVSVGVPKGQLLSLEDVYQIAGCRD